jgi:hypothetical protein
MKPVHVSIDVSAARRDVYEFLAVTANHEAFTDHMLRQWQCSGPARGLGSKTQVTAVVGGRREPVAIEVIDDVPLQSIVERNVSAGGRRIATGTYTLRDLSDGGTRIEFTYAWQQAPVPDRVMGGLVRWLMRRALEVAMSRLAEQLQRLPSQAVRSGE